MKNPWQLKDLSWCAFMLSCRGWCYWKEYKGAPSPPALPIEELMGRLWTEISKKIMQCTALWKYSKQRTQQTLANCILYYTVKQNFLLKLLFESICSSVSTTKCYWVPSWWPTSKYSLSFLSHSSKPSGGLFRRFLCHRLCVVRRSAVACNWISKRSMRQN